MLTCITRSKQTNDDPSAHPNKSSQNTPLDNKQAVKSLGSQIKGMALKASGSYKQCSQCISQPGAPPESDSAASEKFRRIYKRSGSFSSSSMAGRKELEARLKGISSGEVTPTLSASASLRRVDPVVFVEENEPKEWEAQVDSGVLITFVALPRGGNDLKRIRFNRDMYNKLQAQTWWGENYERIMELYHVQRLNRQAFSLPSPARTQGESSKTESVQESLETPLTLERLPSALTRPVAYSESNSLDNQSINSSTFNNTNCDSSSSIFGASTPKVSSISGTPKTITTEASSSGDADASMDTGSLKEYADRSGELSISNASDLETEWVEQDEPGVYITIRALPDGRRELKRVRFSREMFGEVHARVWWEENRARIHKQYLHPGTKE